MPRLAGWSVHEVAFLYAHLVDRVRAHRPARRPHRPVPAEDPRRHLRHPARAAARHAVPGGRLATSRCAGSAGRSRAPSCSSTRSRALNIDWTSGRVAMLVVMVPTRDRDLRLDLGRRRAASSFWTTDGGEFTNAFTYGGTSMAQYPIDIYAHVAAAASSRYLIPTRVRLLLPGALHARQGRSARPAAHRSSSARPLVAARRGRRRRARLAVRRAPLPERRRMIEVEGLRKEFVAARRPLPARARRTVEAVRRHLVPRRARRAARLPRPERRRQVDDDQDADRHPRPDGRARLASPASSRRGSGSSSLAGSARCSASGSSSGGTCR